MPIVLIVLIAVFASVYAAALALRMRMLIAKSAVLVEKSRPFQRIAPDGRPRILIAGDSTAVGTGVDDPRGSIAGHFGKDFPDAEIRNLAINGLRVAGLLRDFPEFPAQSFDLVLLQVGANDILRGTPLPAFSASLGAVFDRACAIGKHVVALHSGNIGLAPFFRWPLTAYYRARSLTIRDAYRRIAAEKGVVYVDLFHEAADDPFMDHPRFYSADLLHLREEGYRVWYEDIRAAMDRARISLQDAGNRPCLAVSADQLLGKSQPAHEGIVI